MRIKLKLTLLVSGAIIVIAAVFLIYPRFVKNDETIFNTVSVSLTPSQNSPTSYPEAAQYSGYQVEWITVSDIKKILLFSNLADKNLSSDLLKQNGCRELSSAGFFNQNGHIGLFVLDGRKYSDAISHSLFDGYFSIDDKLKAVITSETPKNPVLAVQSGPLIILNGSTRNLENSSDEQARRVVVATDVYGRVHFILLYIKSNPLLGPRLSEVPELIKKLTEDTSISVSSALNLDGGSHSAFITNEISVSELSPIGSYFCIKP